MVINGFIQIGQNVGIGASVFRASSASRMTWYPFRSRSRTVGSVSMWKIRARRARCATPSAARFGKHTNTLIPWCAIFSRSPFVFSS